MPQNPVDTTLFVSEIVAGSGVAINQSTGVVTISVSGSEAPTAIVGGATPFPITGKAAATATSAGGEVDVTGAAGGTTSGAGGPAKIAGGAATNGNSAGGDADLTGGAGHGTQPGGNANVIGGPGGTTGNGGAAEVQGGTGGTTSGSGGNTVLAGGNAGTGSNGNGGDVNIIPGVLDGTGAQGVVRIEGTSLIAQGNPSEQDTAATLTAAQILTKIILSNPSGAINVQLPLATAMDTALPSSVAGDAFDFSVISLAGSTNLPTITINTGWTLVGAMVFTAVAGNAGRFRARKTGTGAWTLYRLS